MQYYGGGVGDYDKILHDISYANLQMNMATIPRVDTKPKDEGGTSAEDIQNAASEEPEEIAVEDLMGMFGS